MPPSKDSKRRMLVEGMDDQYTIINLLKQHGVDWDDSSTSPPYIHKCGGIDNLLNQISVTVKGAEYTDIAIVVDANGSIQDRWKSLRGRFADADIELPEQLDTTGTVVVDRAKSRNIGLWIMPDNTMNGALEDFVVNMMPESDRLLDYAQCASKKAKKYGAKFDDIDLPKATLHAWLAWQNTSGVPYGTAINNGFLRSDNECALRFVGWFDRVFPGLVNTAS